ncbi:MAG TPA: hypothetical protein VLA36_05210 [Longimicrobiales bacterium]|nr:hypothetical protein [Longimicrobiales bacterium]
MVRKSLFVVMLLAIAAPLAAQDELVWSSKRPDAQAPFGVMGGQLLEMGEFQFTYRFSQLASKGVWFEKDSLALETSLDYYPVVPLAMDNLTHWVGLAYAPSEDLTLMANFSYSRRHREQLTQEGIFYVTESDQLGDLEISGLYSAFEEGPYRAHLQLGATIPTGEVDATAETPYSSPGVEALPYDQRAGAGTFALSPGLTVLAQNDAGTVGAQVRGTFYMGTNSADFSLGDRYEFNGWAAYRVNRYISVSGRMAYQTWDGIEGADPALDPVRDPGNDAYFLGGSRLDLPVGLNIYMPENTRFAGHRLSVEYFHPVSQTYDGPQLGADWGVVVGWQVAF